MAKKKLLRWKADVFRNIGRNMITIRYNVQKDNCFSIYYIYLAHNPHVVTVNKSENGRRRVEMREFNESL